MGALGGDQRAMRLHQPLPSTTALAVFAVVLVLVGACLVVLVL